MVFLLPLSLILLTKGRLGGLIALTFTWNRLHHEKQAFRGLCQLDYVAESRKLNIRLLIFVSSDAS